jgi:hypothetical protein
MLQYLSGSGWYLDLLDSQPREGKSSIPFVASYSRVSRMRPSVAVATSL